MISKSALHLTGFTIASRMWVIGQVDTVRTIDNNTFIVDHSSFGATNLSLTDTASYEIHNNRFLGTAPGINILGGDARIDATVNWWGDASGPSAGVVDRCDHTTIAHGAGAGIDAASGELCFIHWCLDQGCATVCDDVDLDGICDVYDNCPDTCHPQQIDDDDDGIGDGCDATPHCGGQCGGPASAPAS
jgi:hypothetical protein